MKTLKQIVDAAKRRKILRFFYKGCILEARTPGGHALDIFKVTRDGKALYQATADDLTSAKIIVDSLQ